MSRGEKGLESTMFRQIVAPLLFRAALGVCLQGAAPAAAEDHPIPLSGAVLKLGGPKGASGPQLKLKADVSAEVSIPFEPARDTVAILVRGSATGAGSSGRVVLDAARWTRTGSGHVYRDPSGAVAGIRKAYIRIVDDRLEIFFRAIGPAWPWVPTEPQDSVEVLIQIGSQWVCADFGGRVSRNSDRRFVARRAPAPAACPTICDGEPCDRPGSELAQPFLGDQRVLFLPVLYDGDRGPIIDDSTAIELGEELSSAIALNSYGKAAVFVDVAPPLSLGDASRFSGPGALARIREAAVAAAEAAGFEIESYGREVIFARRTWGGSTGQGTLNNRTSIVSCGGGCAYLVAHELGHSLGLFHASFWWAPHGPAVSRDAREIGYGDPFDIMGDQIRGRPRGFHHFNPWSKKRVGWLADRDVLTVTEPGTYVLRPFEWDTGPGYAALRVRTDRRVSRWKGDYWIVYRATEEHASRGATLTWGYPSNTRNTRLLDMTPGSLPAGEPSPQEDWKDAALLPGEVFVDADVGLAVRVLARRDDRLVVEIGLDTESAPPDLQPVVDVVSSESGRTVYGPTRYRVTAFDPDVGQADGDGIETMTLGLYPLTDPVLAPLIRGEPPEITPEARVVLEHPPFELQVQDPSLPTGVYFLVAMADATDGGRTIVALPHMIDLE